MESTQVAFLEVQERTLRDNLGTNEDRIWRWCVLIKLGVYGDVFFLIPMCQHVCYVIKMLCNQCNQCSDSLDNFSVFLFQAVINEVLRKTSNVVFLLESMLRGAAVSQTRSARVRSRAASATSWP